MTLEQLLAAGVAQQRRFLEESHRADQAFFDGTLDALLDELATNARIDESGNGDDGGGDDQSTVVEGAGGA